MTSVQNQGNQQIQTMNQSQTHFQPQLAQPQPQQLQPNYTTAPQTQTAPPPSYAGVNIQIYNPSVGIPNINPTGNAPASQSLPGIAYPQNYYTQQYGLPQGSGNITAQGGNAVVNNNINSPQTPIENDANTVKALADSTNKTTSSETSKTEKKEENKKTEKRKIVELSDDYIKNLENYLNSQDKEVRMMGAKEVVARLQEDDSRKDDPALTALVNKMLQDPSQQIRFLALSMLDSRTCTGDDYTIGVLKKMQNSTSGYGQDAAQATNILLKMSGKVVEKEFEVPESSSKK